MNETFGSIWEKPMSSSGRTRADYDDEVCNWVCFYL